MRADGHVSATASLGIAQSQDGVPVDETLARADEALYAAKRQGRKSIVAAGASPDARAGYARGTTSPVS